MGQQLRAWRSASSQRLWLSLLIDTAEEISRPELRAVPCDGQVLAASACAACPSGVGFAFLTPRPTACGTERPVPALAYSPASCQPRPLSQFDAAQPRFFARDVVARDRHRRPGAW